MYYDPTGHSLLKIGLGIGLPLATKAVIEAAKTNSSSGSNGNNNNNGVTYNPYIGKYVDSGGNVVPTVSVSTPSGTQQGYIQQGVTYMYDGSRPQDGWIVHAANNVDYQMNTAIGKGAPTTVVDVITPNGITTAGYANGAVTMLDGSRLTNGIAVLQDSKSTSMIIPTSTGWDYITYTSGIYTYETYNEYTGMRTTTLSYGAKAGDRIDDSSAEIKAALRNLSQTPIEIAKDCFLFVSMIGGVYTISVVAPAALLAASGTTAISTGLTSTQIIIGVTTSAMEAMRLADMVVDAYKVGKTAIKTYQVIEGAGKTVSFQGKSVTKDNSLFDPNAMDDMGRTNVQRMQQGLAPRGYDGQSVNIHHIDQTNMGPVKEVSGSTHKQEFSELHINTGQSPSQIDRNTFNQWRADYWKWRAEDFK